MAKKNLNALKAREGERSVEDDVLQVEGASAPKRVNPLAGKLAGAATNTTAYEEDSTEEKVEGDSLALLQSLAEEMINESREVARCARALKDANDRFTDVSEKRLPDLMERFSMARFEFLDRMTGMKLIIKLESDKWRVSMPPMKDDQGNALPENFAKRKIVMQWLRDIGSGASIKKLIEIQAGLLGDELVDALVEEFTATHPELDVGVTEKIEPATLTALVSRLLREGKTVHEAIQVKPVRQAKIAKK